LLHALLRDLIEGLFCAGANIAWIGSKQLHRQQDYTASGDQ